MRSDRKRLQDILQAIEQIEHYTVQGKQAFEEDTLLQSGVLYQIVIIGEASRVLGSALLTQYPDIPWSSIIGMWNIVVHQYFGVDLALVWSVVERNLPELKRMIEAILQKLGDERY
ncbi:MAG TPA: nucleotidyltransferase [Cyanobacteria bacterium UBA8553]|nr:nucleotidyltransferase [Cyanobacteria bacterium UBA8553]HAJ60873.1 nucleotidyltransferase [Cyanobacteria bacterium UBA8543]